MLTAQFYRNMRNPGNETLYLLFSSGHQSGKCALLELGTCLLLRNFNGVSENGPENAWVAGRSCQGSFIAIVLIQSVRKQFLNIETRDQDLLIYKRGFVLNIAS